MSVIDQVKDIAGLVKAIGNMDLYRQILDLQSEILDLAQEKRDLEARVQDLEEKLSFSKKMTFSSPFYFAEGDSIRIARAVGRLNEKRSISRRHSAVLRARDMSALNVKQ